MPALAAIPDRIGNVHNNRQYPIKVGETFLAGAFVKHTAGVIEECGADPAAILGVALEPAGTSPEGTMTAPGTASLAGAVGNVALCESDAAEFWMAANATLVYATHFGNSYGVIKDANGIWVIDISEGANTRVNLRAVDVGRQLAKVGVLAANRQTAP